MQLTVPTNPAVAYMFLKYVHSQGFKVFKSAARQAISANFEESLNFVES
jgi:hypothetical protein